MDDEKEPALELFFGVFFSGCAMLAVVGLLWAFLLALN